MTRPINADEYGRLVDLAIGHDMPLLELARKMEIPFIHHMPRSRLPEARRIVRQWGADQCAAEDANDARREMER